MTLACNAGSVWTCGFEPAVYVIGLIMEITVRQVRLLILKK